ncbi:MAG: DUF6051 family protein [Bacteroidales bacterium]
MDLNLLKNYLKDRYHHNRLIELEDSKMQIVPMLFQEQERNRELQELSLLVPAGSEYCKLPDATILENKQFDYPVFITGKEKKEQECIILLHGLNERNWDKYLPWAKTLCQQTGKAVLLFPIAFHINRTPSSWSSPRENFPWVALRKLQHPSVKNSTFANVALSYRLSASPLRIYTSGRETLFNLWQLMRQIRNGDHPLCASGCRIDFFAYSIGAMIAQVFMLANPENLLSASRFFLFCGGSIFERMNGSAREIMDQIAWNEVKRFYINDYEKPDGFQSGLLPGKTDDSFSKAFISMLRPDFDQDYRTSFYQQAHDRLKIITLKKDQVIPTEGVREAIGEENARPLLTELDFPFDYTHQQPFPTENKKIHPEEISRAFNTIFESACDFLA